MNKIKVLLVEDNPEDARLIRRMLARARTATFDLLCVEQLSTGLERLAEGGVDVVLLDLSLPDSGGLETFVKVQAQAPQVPIIVLTALDDEALSVRAVRESAQDYLVKGQVVAGQGDLLVRAVCHAIERKRVEEVLRQRNRELELLNRAAQMLNSTLDLDQVLVTVLEEVRHLLGVAASSVWLLDRESGELLCRQAAGPQSDVVRGWRLALGEGIAGWVARHGESLIVPDAWDDGRHFAGVDRQTGLELRSILSVPLRTKGDVIGALQVLDEQTARFGPTDLALLELLAASAASAIENAWLFERVQLHAAELEARVARRTAELDERMAELGLFNRALTNLLEDSQAVNHLYQAAAYRLEEVNAEMESFAYTVTHDLRAPLRALESFADALLEDYGGRLDASGQEYACSIVAAAQRMDTLIQDLLAYSRLGRAEISIGRVSLDRVMAGVLKELAADLREKNAQVDVAAPLPQVMGQRRVLTQVLSNLLSNAVKFVAPGTQPQVQIWAEERQQQVRLWVQDNGIGVAPQDQERIFRVFERLHGIETYPGTGIGLAIVHKGMERIGGRVGVESEPGRGSRFWIELPRREETPPRKAEGVYERLFACLVD